MRFMPLYPDFQRIYFTDAPTESLILWLPYHDNRVLVQAAGEAVTLLADSAQVREAFGQAAPLVLGSLNGVTYLTCEVSPDAELPDGCRAIDLRTLHGLISDQEWLIAGYASQVLH